MQKPKKIDSKKYEVMVDNNDSDKLVQNISLQKNKNKKQAQVQKGQQDSKQIVQQNIKKGIDDVIKEISEIHTGSQ